VARLQDLADYYRACDAYLAAGGMPSREYRMA
jgi:hypothetical protein